MIPTAGSNSEAGTEAEERREQNGADHAILEQKLVTRRLEDEDIHIEKRLIPKRPFGPTEDELERGPS